MRLLVYRTKNLSDETRKGLIHIVENEHTLCNKSIDNPLWYTFFSDEIPTCMKCLKAYIKNKEKV